MITERFTKTDRRRGRSRLATVERWASLIGGGALTAWGIKRVVDHRTPGSIGMTAVGGLLLANGFLPRERQRGVHLETSFTINKPAEELYRFWRNFENLPRFMNHLESVKTTGARTSRWTARAPAGASFSWDAEITDERENQWIAWRSLPGSQVDHSGSVRFRQAPGNRGTEVTVAINVEPLGGPVANYLAYVLGPVPERQIREEIRHFKQLTECGEIPTTDGQPSGRRSTVISIIQKAARQPHPRMAGLRTA